jgi:hypothetical protein
VDVTSDAFMAVVSLAVLYLGATGIRDAWRNHHRPPEPQLSEEPVHVTNVHLAPYDWSRFEDWAA